MEWAEFRNHSVIREDSEILAVNKPAGISVVGEHHDTDIIGLAREANERLFPVHRIDKVTSGLVLFAKNLEAHGKLTRQFNKRTVDKRYLIITKSTGLPPEGLIDLPLSTGGKGQVRVAAPRESIYYDEQNNHWEVSSHAHLSDKKMYPSLTRFAVLWANASFTIVLAEPITGRKQQLRVHFAWIGHPIFNDPLFDKTKRGIGWQTCLHSWRLGFDAAWLTETRMEIEAPPPAEFWLPLDAQLSDKMRSEVLRRAREYQFKVPKSFG